MGAFYAGIFTYIAIDIGRPWLIHYHVDTGGWRIRTALAGGAAVSFVGGFVTYYVAESVFEDLFEALVGRLCDSVQRLCIKQ